MSKTTSDGVPKNGETGCRLENQASLWVGSVMGGVSAFDVCLRLGDPDRSNIRGSVRFTIGSSSAQVDRLQLCTELLEVKGRNRCYKSEAFGLN